MLAPVERTTKPAAAGLLALALPAAALALPAPAAAFHGRARGGGALVLLALWLVAGVALGLVAVTWPRDRRENRRRGDHRPPTA